MEHRSVWNDDILHVADNETDGACLMHLDFN